MQRIAFLSDISQEAIQELLRRLQENNKGQVWVDSAGGTFEFFSIYAPMLLQKGFTSVACDVRSAAVILFLLGAKRVALPESTFFFHEVRTITDRGQITICALEEAIEWQREKKASLRKELFEQKLREINNAQNWMLDLISRLTGTSKTRFLSLMRAEATIGAREAVQYGIAHRIATKEELVLL